MRYLLLILLAALSLVSASPTQPQNRIIAQFFEYVESNTDIYFHNGLIITMNFLEQYPEMVPADERTNIQTYVNYGKELLHRGSVEEKVAHLQKAPLNKDHPPYVIRVALEKDVKRLHSIMTEGAAQMKAKLTPVTVARETELYSVIDELINSKTGFELRQIMQRLEKFKNKY